MNTPTAALVLFSTLLAATVAQADNVTVPSNRSTLLGAMTANSPDCRVIGKPGMKTNVLPSHGTVTYKWISSRLGDAAKSCKGKPAHAMGIVYTPAHGFHGQDRFTVGMTFPAYEGYDMKQFHSEDFVVTVR